MNAWLSSLKEFFHHYRYLILLSVFSYFSLLFFIPEYHFDFDAECWQSWSCLMFEHGLGAAYDPVQSDIDYMPIYLYILKGYAGMHESTADIREQLNYLKSIPLLFEVFSIALLAAMVKNKERRLFVFMIGILNIGFLYNSLFWHQVDGILACFLLVSFLFAIRSGVAWSVIFFVLAFNFKIQAVFLLPLLGLLWLDNITLKKALVYFGLALITEFIVILPFLINGRAGYLLDIVFHAYDHYPKISLNAYNLWYMVMLHGLDTTSDKTPLWLGITAHSYGLTLYVLSVLLIIWPLLTNLFRNKFRLQGAVSLKLLILSAALLPYVFFYFNTQMHERYIHCTMIFLTFLAFRYHYWGIYFLVTFNYFLSLEGLLKTHQLFMQKFSFMFGLRTQAVIFTVGLIWLFMLWLKEARETKVFSKRVLNMPSG